MQSPRRVLITGAGSGLGQALAKRYASSGALVACVDLIGERADATCASLTGNGHWQRRYPRNSQAPDGHIAGHTGQRGRQGIRGRGTGRFHDHPDPAGADALATEALVPRVLFPAIAEAYRRRREGQPTLTRLRVAVPIRVRTAKITPDAGDS